jgi:RimJ/RimL family protein N-acetyltransferase
MALPTRVRLKDGRSALVRRATPDDAASITEFVNLVGAERRFVLRERATWTLDEERATLAAATGEYTVFFVAELSGQLAGLINLSRGRWPKDSHVAEFGMSCRPDCRGVGLGTALLSTGIQWARSVGVRKLTLEVFASNDRAIQLYRKAGFAEEARLRGQYIIEQEPVDSLLMALWL